jgi:protoporphyrinogen oxidase
VSGVAEGVVVVGAGPAGLTAGLRLAQAGVSVTVVEASGVVGGISQTVEREGWRFDLGGHRFFTKVPQVEALWHEVLPEGDFLQRPRLSRILYRGRLFDYPLRPGNALRGLGVVEAVRCVLSYLWVRVRPPADRGSFEGWVAARFGWRLYRIFFKTYTEKVWGVAATEISADWAAQRIKDLSLGSAVASALGVRRGGQITTLIDSFQYPRLGPGMMWERCAQLVVAAGGRVRLSAPVVAVEHEGGRARAVVLAGGERLACGQVISSMPLPELVRAVRPAAPAGVLAAADGLGFRDFLTVALVVPVEVGFPDNWIYVHEPSVRVGRVQNFGSWSPELVKDGFTCLGLEYFVSAGDELWSAPDERLVALGTAELVRLGLVSGPQVVQAGYVVRVPLAYPVYDEGYDERVQVLRQWLADTVPNVHPVGRNGMHRYNNQDHSMLTAMLTVENLVSGTAHDVWTVNVEQDYHESSSEPTRSPGPATPPGSSGTGRGSGTGRDAPLLPRRSASREESAA